MPRRTGPCPVCGALRPVVRGHAVASHLIVERRDGQIFERRCAGSYAPRPAHVILHRHARGEVSEGQAAARLGVDRVEVRAQLDEWLEANQHRHADLRLRRQGWLTTWESARER